MHFFQESKFLRNETLEDVVPGRRYCVSVCFFDRLVPRKSNYSRPYCVFTRGNYDTGTGSSSVSLADFPPLMLRVVGGRHVLFDSKEVLSVCDQSDVWSSQCCGGTLSETTDADII